ncbi:MAG: MFS transporter [Erysipelothrix sp.]|nr:MFS transporter [Erysipelothrix sp.]
MNEIQKKQKIDKDNQKSLWTKNFTLMFTGTVLSGLGGVGMNVAMSVIVFDYTQSTFLTSLFTAILFIPVLVLPLFIGSIVDRQDPHKLLLKNETFLLGVYSLIFVFYYFFGFQYWPILIFFVFTSSFSLISDLSSQTISAQLMPKHLMSQGYSILSTIYPLCQVIVVPFALYLYNTYGFALLILIFIILSTCDLLLEIQIKYDFTYDVDKGSSFKDTVMDMKEGFAYLKSNVPVFNVFKFFTVSTIASGSGSLLYPFFASSSHLTIENYGLLMSITSMGYMFGGFFHYFVEIPKKKRYLVAISIYAMFIIFESVFLFMPLLIMLLMKFMMGLGGMNSSNIRNTAVQASIEDIYRGKVNGVFAMMMGFANIVGNLLFGTLAEFIPIPVAIIFAQSIYAVTLIVVALPRKYKLKELYNLELVVEKI